MNNFLRNLVAALRNVTGGDSDRELHERFVQAVYRGCLRREPDEAGFSHYVSELAARNLAWHDLLRAVLDSDEFASLAVHSRAVDGALLNLHECRKALYSQYLPAAAKVVDLGGVSNDDEEGALFALGYPYAPTDLTIVDLPLSERFEGSQVPPPSQLLASRGTLVRYEYGSMTNLSFADDSSIDMVVSGQSIEHIEEIEADRMLSEVFRILRPAGRLCLDTPNAKLTRMQSPAVLIHPEHKKEYTVGELRAKLRQHGFEIRRELGVCPMPVSSKTGYFDYREMRTSRGVGEEPEIGYAFYLEAVKPSPEQTN